MKIINDCLKSGSLLFEIFDRCYSAQDIWIENQQTLLMVEDLIRRVNILESTELTGPQGPAGPSGPQGPQGLRGLPGKDCVIKIECNHDHIWIDKDKQKRCFFRASELKPCPGWENIGGGWWRRKSRYNKYIYTQFKINQFTQLTGRKYWIYSQDDWLKINKNPETKSPRDFNFISMADWYKKLQINYDSK